LRHKGLRQAFVAAENQERPAHRSFTSPAAGPYWDIFFSKQAMFWPSAETGRNVLAGDLRRQFKRE